jgi:transposase-like protein
MGRKSKFSKETKILTVKQYQSGNKSKLELANELGCEVSSILRWIGSYESMGGKAFDEKLRNRAYSQAFKFEAIKAYLDGKGSYRDIAKQYQIPSEVTIINWVSKYNRHNEIKAYDPKGYVYMAKTRKVSFEEKLEIIKWTIEHEHQYKLAAEKFETAYSQVYSWVRKYKAEGEAGLKDERGKRKPVEHLTEIEKLKREVELLRRKNERLEMEAEVIKKFQEIERRDILARSGKKPNTKR